MLAILYNLYQNCVLSWKYGEPYFQEPEEWESEKVTIISLKEQKLINSSSYRYRFIDVALRLYSIFHNSWLLYRYGYFDLTRKILTLPKGKYRSIYYFPTFKANLVFITDPNIMRSVLQHERNETGINGFFSGGIPTEIAKKILGPNLLSYPDTEHSIFRKALLPYLTHIKQFDHLLYSSIKSKMENWQAKDFIVVSPMLPALIVEAVCRCYLQYEGPFQEITRAIEILLSNVGKNENQEYAASLSFLERCATEVEECCWNNKFLQNIEKNKLRSFIKLMFFAGQDTTSALIEYLVLSLGQKDLQDYQDIIYQHWLNSKQAVFNFAQESPDLECIIKEALRLHPPSFEQTRRVIQDLVIDNKFIVPKDSELHLNHLYSQRDIRRWGIDAQIFNPLRQLNKENTKQATYTFSTGPTTCLGRSFALMLVKIFLMTIITEFKWHSVSRLEKLNGHIALKIEPEVKIFIEKRRGLS